MEKVAFKPLNTAIPNVKELDYNYLRMIPPYEDQGVRYQGYSKKLIGSDQYQLKKQTQVSAMFSIQQTGNAIGNAALYITEKDQEKTFYLTDIIISVLDYNAIATASLGIGSVNPLYLNIGVRGILAFTPFTTILQIPYTFPSCDGRPASPLIRVMNTSIRLSTPVAFKRVLGISGTQTIAVQDAAGGVASAWLRVTLNGWFE